jgi:hypothetical protein
MATIDAEYTDASGNIRENNVARPSVQRKALKESLLRQINRSPALQKELYRANELYQLLKPKKFTSRLVHKTTTTQSIRLRPAM